MTLLLNIIHARLFILDKDDLWPGSLNPQGAGTVHGKVAPPCDEHPGAAEGWVPHDHSLGGLGYPCPWAQVGCGHKARPATHQVNHSTACIVLGS